MFEPRLEVLGELPQDAEYDLPEELLAAADGLEPDLRRSLAWSVAIAAAQSDLDAAMSRTPGARYTAIGFFDPYHEDQTPDTFSGFGVIVYTDAAVPVPERRPESITVRGMPFTVLARPGVFEPQVTISVGRRQSGRVACWATSRQGAHKGWLTAKHCATALGKVLDPAPDCVDAALVSTGTNGGGSVRKAFQALTAGTTVDMQFGSKPGTATVLDVSTDFGLLKSGKFPLRFSTDRAGVPGDSGSLITEAASTDPLGMYLGSFTPVVNPKGLTGGIGLSLYQLEQMMDLEIYL